MIEIIDLLSTCGARKYITIKNVNYLRDSILVSNNKLIVSTEDTLLFYDTRLYNCFAKIKMDIPESFYAYPRFDHFNMGILSNDTIVIGYSNRSEGSRISLVI